MQPVSPSHSQVAEHSFDRIVMHLDTTILQKHLKILLNCLIQDSSVCGKHPYTRVLEDGIFLYTVTTATLLVFHHTKLGFHGEGCMVSSTKKFTNIHHFMLPNKS